MHEEGEGERLTVEGTMLPHMLRTYHSIFGSIWGRGGGNLISLPRYLTWGGECGLGPAKTTQTESIAGVQLPRGGGAKQERFLLPWQGALHREGSWCCEQAGAGAFRYSLSGGEFPADK